MAKHEFSSDNQPAKRNGRGKSERTKILEAMKRGNQSEESFYDHLVTRAFNAEDNFGAPELLRRLAPLSKSTLPLIEFEFDEDATPKIQSSQVLKAAADGVIPPDIAQVFITSIASMLKIDEVTELQKRLEAIEISLGVRND